MSGNKQHYIPRALLRGFTQRSGQDGQVFVVNRDKRYISNISDVAARRQFYGPPGRGSLDDVITDFEARFGSFFHRLRTAGVSEQLDAKEIGTMMAHLFLRSLALRETQTSMMRGTFQMFEELGKDDDAVGSAFDELVADDKWLRKSFNEEASRHGLKFSEVQIQAALGSARAKYENERGTLVSGLGHQLQAGARMMQGKAHENAEQTQFSLLTSFDDRCDGLIARFALLEWRLVDFSEPEHLYLGDNPVVLLGDQYTASNITTEEWQGAFLPISSQRVLLGHLEEKLALSAADIRAATIRTAFEFIVCHPSKKSEFFDLKDLGVDRIENGSKWRETLSELRDSLAKPLSGDS